MSYEQDEFYEGDDYEEERPRDDKIDDAKRKLRTELFAANQDTVYYQRQIETRYERDFFHWITAKALNELTAEGFISSSLVQIAGNANIRFYWWPRKSLLKASSKFH